MERYRTIAGEIIEYETPSPEVAKFLARVVDAANDPRVPESELIDLVYGTENPIMAQGIIPGRGIVTKAVFDNPIYRVMTDLMGVKRVQTGTLDLDLALSQYTVTVTEAAKRLGVHPSAVRQAIQQRRLAAIKKGNIHLLRPASIEAYRVSRRGPKPRGEETEAPALTVCTGNDERGSFRIAVRGGALDRTGHGPRRVEGIVRSFERAAVICGGKGDYRLFELEPASTEEEIKMGPFHVRGRFKIVRKENNPRRANEGWKAFKADAEAVEGKE